MSLDSLVSLLSFHYIDTLEAHLRLFLCHKRIQRIRYIDGLNPLSAIEDPANSVIVLHPVTMTVDVMNLVLQVRNVNHVVCSLKNWIDPEFWSISYV